MDRDRAGLTMDGVHDLGGLAGFGPVDHVVEEPSFHEDWERRAFKVNLAILGATGAGGWTWRHAIERMDPAHYLSSSYYEHWLTASTSLFVEAGHITREELERRTGGRVPLARPDRGSAPVVAGDRTEPRFAVGDRVRVREWHPLGHTRAPRYAQGKRGVVTRIDGAFNLPDVEAHGGRHVLDPTYSVRFTSIELWGECGTDGDIINVDLWEHYLEEDA